MKLLISLLFTLCFANALNWQQYISIGPVPLATELGGMSVIGTNVYYWGGLRSCSGNGTTCGGASNCVNIFPDGMSMLNTAIPTTITKPIGEWVFNIDSGSINRPNARADFGYATKGNRFMIYGGVTYNGTSTSTCSVTFYDGLWSFNVNTLQWKRLDNASDPYSPGPRAGAGMSIHKGDVYLIGGLTGSYVLQNDVRVFDLNTKTWSIAHAGGANSSFPAARYNHVQLSDDVNERILIIWGDNYLGGAIVPHINDIWEFQSASNIWKLREVGSKQATQHPVGGVYKEILYIGGGDYRPRPNLVLSNTSQVIGQVQVEIQDQVTKYDAQVSDLHYAFDSTQNGGQQTLLQVYPGASPGPFKKSAFSTNSTDSRYLFMRGGYNWICPKHQIRCVTSYLENVYKVDLFQLYGLFN